MQIIWLQKLSHLFLKYKPYSVVAYHTFRSARAVKNGKLFAGEGKQQIITF